MTTHADAHALARRHMTLIGAGLLATYMQAINISLPNAAVLHVQGGLSMTATKPAGCFPPTSPPVRW